MPLIRMPLNRNLSADLFSKQNKVKYSYGVALCRFNRTTDEPEILLIRKRVTYEFAEFVYGRYNVNNVNKLSMLINAMTCNEKILLKSLDFDKIWWHLTLGNSSTANYEKLKKKFTLLINTNLYIFTNLIDNSVDGELIWEIPKGRAKNIEEPTETAIRETEEEVGIKYSNYLLMNKSFEYSMTSYDVNYVMRYYMAHYINPLSEYRFVFRDRQLIEIDAIKWWSISDLKLKKNDHYLNFVYRILLNFASLRSKDKEQLDSA